MSSSLEQSLEAVLVSRIKDGQVIGLGSGTTTERVIHAFGEKIAKEKLTIFGVPTSFRTAQIAEGAGIHILPVSTTRAIDWAFDGADEVSPERGLIKGRGGALLLEKIIAARAAHFVVIVSDSKLVQILGTKFAVPVEVIPAAVSYVEQQLLALGATEIILRESGGKYGPVVTENGNLLLDVRFRVITEQLEATINSITGVVENGLFFNFADEILVESGSPIKVSIL